MSVSALISKGEILKRFVVSGDGAVIIIIKLVGKLVYILTGINPSLRPLSGGGRHWPLCGDILSFRDGGFVLHFYRFVTCCNFVTYNAVYLNNRTSFKIEAASEPLSY